MEQAMSTVVDPTLSPQTRLALLALAGAAGTLARYGVSVGVQYLAPGLGKVPIATLIVNVLGCTAFGVLWALAEAQPQFSRLTEPARFLLLTGFMGAFTTFSTFAFETGKYLQSGEYPAAIGYVLASNVLGISGFLAGSWCVQRAFGSL